MSQPTLLDRIKPKLVKYINSYVNHRALENIDNYLVAPGLEDKSGILGSIAIAEKALSQKL